MPSDLVFLFDFGGSYTKAHVWEHGMFKKQVRIPSTKITRSALGEYEINPIEFRDELIQFFKKLINEFGKPAEIAITGQMATYLIVGSRLNPVTPIISWQDERSLARQQDSESWYENKKKSLLKLRAINYDGVRAGLPLMYLSAILEGGGIPGAEKILSINQYAALILNDDLELKDIQTHESEAAATGLYDLKNQSWNQELLNFSGVEIDMLPKVSNNFDYIGKGQIGTHKTRIPIGDFQAAIAGVKLKSNELFVHMATGGQVAKLSNRGTFSKADRENWIQLRPALNNSVVIQTVTHLPAGRLLGSLVGILEQIGIQNSWERLDQYFCGESALIFNIDMTDRRDFGLDRIPTSGLEIENLLKGICQGVLKTYNSVIGKMLSSEIDTLVFSGGALNKLPRFMEGINPADLQLTLRTHEDLDTSLKGLANLVGLES